MSLTNERGNRFEGIVAKKYQDASKSTKGKKVLDLGCGLGAGAKLLANQGAALVIGIDYSKQAINYAKKNNSAPNLEYIKMDAMDLNFKNHFDIITCFELIEHLPPENHKEFVYKLSKMLKTNGICFCSTPNKLVSSPDRKKPYNPYHKMEFTPSEFISLFNKYFENVEIMGYKNINQQFMKSRKNIGNSRRYKIVDFISRYKLTHEITPYLATSFKNIFTQKKKLPKLDPSSFQLTKDINSAECLLIIAK